MADAENAVPPTSWLVLVTPGMSTPIWPTDFVPAGMALMTSRVIDPLLHDVLDVDGRRLARRP